MHRTFSLIQDLNQQLLARLLILHSDWRLVISLWRASMLVFIDGIAFNLLFKTETISDLSWPTSSLKAALLHIRQRNGSSLAVSFCSSFWLTLAHPRWYHTFTKDCFMPAINYLFKTHGTMVARQPPTLRLYWRLTGFLAARSRLTSIYY